MTKLTFACSCGLEIEAEEDSFGQATQCPICQQDLIVPFPQPMNSESTPPITFECSGCRQLVEVEARHAGELIYCPNCQAQVKVPPPRLAAPPLAAKRTSAPAAKAMPQIKDETAGARAFFRNLLKTIGALIFIFAALMCFGLMKANAPNQALVFIFIGGFVGWIFWKLGALIRR